MTTLNRPNPHAMRALENAAADHAIQQHARRWMPHNLPFWIVAIANGDLDLTPVDLLARNARCDTCGGHCPKKTTPVFLYKRNKCGYFFCDICLDALKQSAGIYDVCKQIVDVEHDCVYARTHDIGTERAEYALSKLREQLRIYLSQVSRSVTS